MEKRKERELPDLWSQDSGKIALTIATHFAREPSKVIAVEVPATATPHELADTVVKSVGGVYGDSITEMVDKRGRNLMEQQYRDNPFKELGIGSSETLEIQGDITQG